MERKVNKNKFWKLVLFVAALAFLVIGIVKIVNGHDYLLASTSLINSLIFMLLVWRISREKINFDVPNDGLKIFFPIGFVFAIAGSSGYLSAGIWGFGITLIVVGLVFSPQEGEEFKEEKNAG